jgi:hypothetical protein
VTLIPILQQILRLGACTTKIAVSIIRRVREIVEYMDSKVKLGTPEVMFILVEEIWKFKLEVGESIYVIATLNFRTPLSITLLLFFVWKNF